MPRPTKPKVVVMCALKAPQVEAGDLFVENKYFKWYTNLVSIKDEGMYVEKHHKIPRALGGSDDESNLVSLSYRKHFLAHWLLTKCVANAYRLKMSQAMIMMLAGSNRISSSWQYEIAKQALKNELIGKPCSPEVKNKISLSLQGRKQSPEVIARRANSNRGKKRSQETKMKIGIANSKSLKGRKRNPEAIEKTTSKLRGKPNLALLGRKRDATAVAKMMKTNLLKKEAGIVVNSGTRQFTFCSHCGIYSNRAILKRWHFDNCPQKKKLETPFFLQEA